MDMVRHLCTVSRSLGEIPIKKIFSGHFFLQTKDFECVLICIRMKFQNTAQKTGRQKINPKNSVHALLKIYVILDPETLPHAG